MVGYPSDSLASCLLNSKYRVPLFHLAWHTDSTPHFKPIARLLKIGGYHLNVSTRGCQSFCRAYTVVSTLISFAKISIQLLISKISSIAFILNASVLYTLRHDIAATCMLKVPLNPNQPTNQPRLQMTCGRHLCHFVDRGLIEMQQLFHEQGIFHTIGIQILPNNTVHAAVFSQREAPSANVHYSLLVCRVVAL